MLAALDMVKDAMKVAIHKGTHTGTGRNTKWIQQYKQDMIDYIRADTIDECRDHEIAWVDVYDAAYAILKGSRAVGGPDAMEKSYKRNKKRGESQPKLYYNIRSVQMVEDSTQPNREVWTYVNSLRRKK
mgnify:CR=1 FL=1